MGLGVAAISIGDTSAPGDVGVGVVRERGVHDPGDPALHVRHCVCNNATGGWAGGGLVEESHGGGGGGGGGWARAWGIGDEVK